MSQTFSGWVCVAEEIGDLIEILSTRLFRKYQQMKENK
jgi:hypothetical protein